MILRTILLALWIAAVTGAGQLYFSAPLWLAAGGVNLAAFLLFGLDKLLAAKDWSRIPEAELWFAALIGGGGGAIAGELCFRHKSSKNSFNLILFPIVIVQILLGAAAIAAKTENWL